MWIVPFRCWNEIKKKYEDYSIVLVIGAMAIMYFITYAAYNYYTLIPHVFAFVIMVICIVFNYVIAIYYNRLLIAHIGIVGGYAVPFLLSGGSKLEYYSVTWQLLISEFLSSHLKNIGNYFSILHSY